MLKQLKSGGSTFLACLYDAGKGRDRKYIFFWFEARVSHIPRAKSVLAMGVAKAGAVQQGAHSKRNYLRILDEQK